MYLPPWNPRRNRPKPLKHQEQRIPLADPVQATKLAKSRAGRPVDRRDWSAIIHWPQYLPH